MTVTVLRVDTGQPFIDKAELVTNPDSSVSFQLSDDTFAGQEPMQYGVRHDGPNAQYQRARMTGNVVTFQTRPEDPPMAYLLGIGQVFPA